MNRRGFLKLFGGAAAATAAAAIAPKYFFAPIGGWKSSILVNPIECTIGQYADYPPLTELVKVYYDKRFVENLKQQTPFARLAALHEIPEHCGQTIRFVGASL